MYIAKTKKQFEVFFRAEILPDLKSQEREWQGKVNASIDYPLRREAWNNLIDSMIKERELPAYAENWCAPW